MEINNIIKSANFLEFVNNVDDLVMEILYDPDSGYVNLTSKNAINEAMNKLKYFDETVAKLIEESKMSDVDAVVSQKRENLIEEIKKHYYSETFIWCDEIYQNCIENCKTSIAINREDREKTDKIFQKAIGMISWISDIKNLTPDEQNVLFEQFNKELDETIKSNKYKNQITKSNEKKYLELFEKIVDEELLKVDLKLYEDHLVKEDLNYFKQIQTNLTTYKINSIKDEIKLIQSGIQVLNLKNDKEKYEFIKEVQNDFVFYGLENKKLAQEDKTGIVKQRISIFKDDLNYFKNLLKQEKN